MEVELVKKNETIPDPSMREVEISLETRDQSGDRTHFANHECYNPEEVFSYYGP